jgi:two-component system response regulator FlrC
LNPVLVVDDDVQMQAALGAAVRRKGLDVETASNGLEALRKVQTTTYAAVLTDLRMPGMDGLELLDQLRRTNPGLPVIVLSAFGTVPDAVQALKSGAVNFLMKPFSHEALDAVLHSLDAPGPAPSMAPSEIITANAEMVSFLQRAASVAQTRATILIQAESGTGKEMLARWIHRSSACAGGPFVAVNCAALPERKSARVGVVWLREGRLHRRDDV